MKKQIKVLTIGGATQDIFLHYKDLDTISLPQNHDKKNYILLEEGSKIDLKQINYYSGGGSTNAAVSFKRLGFNVSAIFKLGKDFQGDFILNDLKKENIDVSHVVYSDTLPTATSVIFPCPSGDRVVLADRGANKDLNIEDFSLEIIKNYDAIYITSLSGNSANIFFKITEYAKKHKVFVAINPGINQLKSNIPEFIKTLQNVDILTLNNSEAIELYSSLINKRPFTIEEFFKKISLLGPKIITITNGANGVSAFENNTIYFHPSIAPKKIINTLGAGDAFGSCFVANILLGLEIEVALFSGVINSYSVISNEGAKIGLLSLDQLKEIIKNTKHEVTKKKL